MVHNTHLVLWRVTPLWAVRLAARQGQLLQVPAWGFVADRDLDRSVRFFRTLSPGSSREEESWFCVRFLQRVGFLKMPGEHRRTDFPMCDTPVKLILNSRSQRKEKRRMWAHFTTSQWIIFSSG